MKKGPLSNEEKQFVTDNVGQFANVEDLAENMNRSVSILQKFIDGLPPKGQDVSGLFARKEDRGVTVMTEAASMASDENKAERSTSAPPRFRQYIHKIKE